MRRAVDSPLLMVFLRALVFVGLTEAILYRLLPEPRGVRDPQLLERLHASLSNAGEKTFILACLLAMIALTTVGTGTIRHRTWPPGLNGFLSACMVSLASLGLSALLIDRGPVFAIAFTTLSFLVMLFMAMHAFSSSLSGWGRAFAVSYACVVLCSTLGSIINFTDYAVPLQGPAAFMIDLIRPSLSAGEIFLTVSAVAAFMAFFDFGRLEATRTPLWMVTALAATPAVSLAAVSLLAPRGFAFLGADPNPVRVALLSTALFLGALTAISNLIDPDRKVLGYGLLLLVLAGYPLRITHQDMLMVLGAALAFAPPVERDLPITLQLFDRMRPI